MQPLKVTFSKRTEERRRLKGRDVNAAEFIRSDSLTSGFGSSPPADPAEEQYGAGKAISCFGERRDVTELQVSVRAA